MEKKKINLKIRNVEFLNQVDAPFVKYSKDLLSKMKSHENLGFVKFASSDKKEEENILKSLSFPEDFDLKKDMESHPDNLYVKALAIVADEMNENGDYFSEEELKKSYDTFVGCPLFVNHKNDDVEEARGQILHAEWSDEEHGVVIIGRVDAKAYPKLARGISEGYINGVSMGCTVQYSVCSVCKNKAEKEDSYCKHVKENKARTFNGKKVYEENHGVKFIELSFVVDPACEQCNIQEIFDIEDLKEKVANISEGLRKVASKFAGKVEVDKLNQAEKLMQEVAKAMLDQKDQLQLEYVSDLVEALSKLQETKDELVDMGYSQLPSAGSTETTPETTTPSSPVPPTAGMEEKGQNMEQQNIETSEPTSQAPAGGVGTVTMPNGFASSMNKRIITANIFEHNIRQSLINKWNKE